jgi:hypothetical protein
VFELKITDYVKVTAEHDGWDEVTFGDALNMATVRIPLDSGRRFWRKPATDSD